MTAAPLFMTSRLRALRWDGSELADLLAVYGDADAMRWVGDGASISAAECERWLEVTRANYAKRGYGMFKFVLVETGAVAGFGGIVHPGGQPEAEVKYAWRRAHWGQGLATEALTGLVRYAADAHGLTRLIATAKPENLASHRVLTKAGFMRGALRDNGDGSRTQLFEWHA